VYHYAIRGAFARAALSPGVRRPARVSPLRLSCAAVDYGRPLELPPHPGTRYLAFCDPSGGRHDCFTLCIGYKEGERFGRIRRSNSLEREINQLKTQLAAA
jgi:hypothetical protein